MSQKSAKKLRRQVYGDLSTRDRAYVSSKVRKGFRDGEEVRVFAGTIRNHPDSPRAAYQAAKREGVKS